MMSNRIAKFENNELAFPNRDGIHPYDIHSKAITQFQLKFLIFPAKFQFSANENSSYNSKYATVKLLFQVNSSKNRGLQNRLK